ncbi:MAG: hypothetical protein CMH57_07735 [Myxococcales bacterium]|nr:hypothetical protein [Myxococcales bacterium]
MKILHIEQEPIRTFSCFNVAPGGKRVEERQIPVLRAVVDELGSPELDAILVTSDLQGYNSSEHPVGERRLLGHVVAEEATALFTDPSRVGVILGGDLYAIPELNKRGGLGDVEGVWSTFARHFRWVVGVAGNHDSFAGHTDFLDVFADEPTAFPLHGTAVHLDGVWMGGVSGVHGPLVRPWRHSSRDFKRMFKSVLATRPDVLVLHEGPDHPDHPKAGRRAIRKALNKAEASALVICGHRHWDTPLATLKGGTQILNVDSRVVLLTREETRLAV